MDVFIFIIFLSLILSAFFAWFFYSKSRHDERKLMIQQGGDFSENFFLPKETSLKYVWLKVGILVVGIGLGMVIIAIISTFDLYLNGIFFRG